MARPRIDPRLSYDSAAHKDYIDLVTSLERHFKDQSVSFLAESNNFWDLFLAIQEDTRDQIDELWRSNVFVPLPFSTTRTKAAQITEMLGNTEPVWQVEAIREQGNWYESSKHIERLLDYTHRQNSWRKFLHKLITARSVQGTAFFKVVWTKRAHTYSYYPAPEEEEVFQKALIDAVKQGAPAYPDPIREPEAFDQWRELVNTSNQFGQIPAAPMEGLKTSTDYEGPLFQYIPLWAIRLDPMIDEIKDQKYLMHRMVKPLSYVLDRASNDFGDNKPFYLKNVEEAMSGWDGQVLEQEEQQLAESLGLNPNKESHPYFKKAVELFEVWSPEEPFKYTLMMNKKAVINKRPFENPLLTTVPNIFALRNIMIPGHFYGLSDYHEPRTLFTELNSFRRIRMDGATLTTLPVFVKQAGVQLTEALKKIKPGLVITLPVKDAISSLIKHSLPPEAYREPVEIKQEIEDATETPNYIKGAGATVNRVTGTEYAGRQSQTLLKFKVDSSLIEEELLQLPPVCLAFFATLGPDTLRMEIGGDPNALVDVTKDKLIQAIGMRYRFRGATKNLQPDLQVQQLTTAIAALGDVLAPEERRATLQLILELMDIRGYSKILSQSGGIQVAMNAKLAQGATNAQNVATKDQTEQMNVPVPASVPAETAAAMTGGQNG